MLSASAAEWIARIRSRGLTWALAAAIVLLQYPLWLGDGGVPEVLRTALDAGARVLGVTPHRDTLEELFIRKAVKGMLPRTRLARAQILKLKVYAGPEHPHVAQQPIPLSTDD